MGFSPTPIGKPLLHVDVAIIGAGINGAATARELSRMGHSVVLLDKGDIGAGTSSASSKLLHGGIRYLENGELKLVFEACQERYHWLKHAPHLTQKQSFIIPIYRHHKRKKWMIHAGILLYGLLSGFRQVGRNRMLSVAETLKRQPGLNPQGLVGSALYYDAQVDDARMCLECALQAENWGTKLYTYHQIDRIAHEGNRYILSGKNTLKDKSFSFTADAIVQATGPWTDILNAQGYQSHTDSISTQAPTPLLRPSIGSHIVTPSFLKEDALLISANDGRVFFAIPWQGKTLIGTTDHPYADTPDNASISAQDVAYLFENLYAIMPQLPKPLPILGTFTGIRPLTRDNHSSVGSTSREHAFTWLSNKHLCITGGKYTTFRRIAKDAAELISEKLPRPNLVIDPIETLFGGRVTPDLLPELATLAPYLEKEQLKTLIRRYGAAARYVLPYLLGKDNTRFLTPTMLRGEIGYMIAVEKAKTLDDILRRRSTLFVDLKPDLLEEIAQTCLEALGWTPAEKNKAIADATERYIHAVHRLSQP